METVIYLVKIIGGLSGIVALTWKLLELSNAYLKIKVETKYQQGAYLVQTMVNNHSRFFAKEISNSFVIISPDNMDIITAGKSISNHLSNHTNLNSTNLFTIFRPVNPVYLNNQIAIIPLPFYYSENIRIGDEKLNFSVQVEQTKLAAGTYYVRFFVFHEKRYHRSTQDILIIP